MDRPALVLTKQSQLQFTYSAPDQSWFTDITYVRTHKNWLYLAVVDEFYSRLNVRWIMQARIETRLVLVTLTMVIWRRSPPNSVIICPDPDNQLGSD